MTKPITIECNIHFERRGRGSRKEVHQGETPTASPCLGRVPRVARFMALALRFDELIRTGVVADYADLARLGHVTRARITQMMNLLLLAPDIQEAILFLPRVERGYDPIHLRQLQPIALVPDWRKQRRLWAKLAEAGQALRRSWIDLWTANRTHPSAHVAAAGRVGQGGH
jgi:hypothetical protein